MMKYNHFGLVKQTYTNTTLALSVVSTEISSRKGLCWLRAVEQGLPPLSRQPALYSLQPSTIMLSQMHVFLVCFPLTRRKWNSRVHNTGGKEAPGQPCVFSGCGAITMSLLSSCRRLLLSLRIREPRSSKAGTHLRLHR